MANLTLDNISKQEILQALVGLTGKDLTAEIRRQAEFYNISTARIYELTKSIRPSRKPRTDKGTRKADLQTDEGLRFAAELVITRNLDPYWALRTAQDNGHAINVALGTFQRYLREHQLSLKERKKPVRAYRRWEASAPGELFQFDISGVKLRWMDRTTRKILNVTPLEISKNHPNDDPNRVPLWKFVLVDDFSRMVFIRFYAISKPNSTDIADFLLKAFRELGVPKTLYSDNDAVIVSKMMRRAERLLNDAFLESGGFKLSQHLPGNAQASGKVERTHQIVEAFEKLIGVKKFTPDLEALNRFTERFCQYLNYDKIHSVTRQRPIQRWQSVVHTLRIPAPETLDTAFKCRELERTINPDLTISVDGKTYQVPREVPFTDWITKKVLVLWPAADADWLSLCNPNDLHYADVWFTIDRKYAVADAAGDFRSVADNQQQRLIKDLKASAKERRAAIELPEQDIITPGFDTPLSESDFKPIAFPKPTVAMPTDGLITGTPSTRGLRYWEAMDKLVEQELLTYEQADKDWLRSVFSERETIPEEELFTALETRNAKPETNHILNFERRKLA